MTDREAIYAIERLFLDSTSEDYPFTEEFDTAFNYAEGIDMDVYPFFCPMCGRPLKEET